MILKNNRTNKSHLIQGKNIKITTSFSCENKDMSGEDSKTDTANAGNKPKVVSVSLQIPVEEKTWLTSIVLLAESTEANGDRTIYNIIHELCGAMNIKLVRFDGNVSCKENSTLRAWDVSFSLKEVKSVSEKKEERNNQKEQKVETINGKVVTKAENYVKLKKSIEETKKSKSSKKTKASKKSPRKRK